MNRLRRNRVKICFMVFISSILIVLPFENISGQSDEALRSIFSSADIKKLDKANEYKKQGDELIEEANQLYMETFAVQADVQLDEKAIKKKVDQLETKAQQKQFEALELYNKCNDTKFGIYKKYIENFWSDFNGDESSYVNARLIEEQSNDYYYQAATKRNDAGKEKDKKEKIKMLNDANDLQIRALEKQITALGIYYSIETPVQQAATSPAVPAGQPEQTSPVPGNVQPAAATASPSTVGLAGNQPSAGNVEVNKDIIDIYNRYLSDTSHRTDNFLTPEILARISSFDANQILNIWYNYAYGEFYTPEYEQQMLAEQQSGAVDSVPVDLSAEQYQQYQEMSVQEKAEETKEAAQTELKIAEIHKGEENKVSLLPADENIIYRVQLAANKSQLTQRALQKIYYGNKKVEMIMEDGWFKYSIGDFPDFKSADKFRSQCGVDNAFIVAYRKGTRFTSPAEAAPVAAQLPAEYEKSPEIEGLIFRVQVAASHVSLNKGQLARIYSGNYPVELIEEDGWYKYQILGVRLFSDAIRIIRDSGVKGAFVVAYDNDSRIDLLDAVKKSRKIEKEVQSYGRRRTVKDIEFFVQVAASQVPLRQNELMRIYPGSYQTTLIFEEGWYKYRIKAGTSYEEALKIKEGCGVDKAFIVAYDRALKIPLYQAKEKTRQYNQ